MPRGDGGINIKLLRQSGSEACLDSSGDDRRGAAQAAAAPPAGPREDEPEAFMSVERLKKLPRKHGHGTARLGRRLVMLLADARTGPARRQLSLAEAIGDGGTRFPLPIRGGNFRRFRLSLSKRSRPVGPCCGGPATSRPRRGRRRRRRRRTRTRRAARARSGRRLASRCVDADLGRAPDAGLPHAQAAGGESIAG